jgi:hypothetical protein
MVKNIILTETGFKNIYRGYLKYLALQSGGVDNWEWYGDSLGNFLKERYLENYPDKTLENLFDEDYDFDTVVEEDLDKGKFIVQEVYHAN